MEDLLNAAGIYAKESYDHLLRADYDLLANELEEGEIMDLGDEQEDAAPKVSAPDPGAPSKRERDIHREDHVPYRCWCEHCVKGRGLGEAHVPGECGAVPVVSFDYLIITKNGEFRQKGDDKYEILLKILVVKDSKSKAIFAHVVPQKGVGEDRFAVDCLRKDLLWLGYPRVLLKSDNEPSIKSLLKDVLKGVRIDAGDQAAEKAPPAYDSQANGDAENAIRQVQGLVRTLKSCLEERMNIKLPTTHAAMWWLVRHAAWLLLVRVRGRDGRTAYERSRGRPFNKRFAAFGEVCLFKLAKKRGFDGYDERGKLATRWAKGVFLGYDSLSNEYLYFSQGRIAKSRALQRISEDARWNAQAVGEINVTPHDAYVKPNPEIVFGQQPAKEQQAPEKPKTVRDVKLFKDDFGKFGYTNEGCDRCKWAVRFGWETATTLPHSKECRERVKQALRESGPEGKQREGGATSRGALGADSPDYL